MLAFKALHQLFISSLCALQAYKEKLYGPRYQWFHWSGRHGLISQMTNSETYQDGCTDEQVWPIYLTQHSNSFARPKIKCGSEAQKQNECSKTSLSSQITSLLSLQVQKAAEGALFFNPITLDDERPLYTKGISGYVSLRLDRRSFCVCSGSVLLPHRLRNLFLQSSK